MTDVPTLHTERLTLRAHRESDFDDVFTMWAAPEVVRHISGRPFTREESWTKILRYAGGWPLLGFGYWAVCDRATGRFIGDVGFADFKREMNPSIAGTPEMGWVLTPSAHGRGLATEATRAALDWLDSRSGPRRTVCIIDPPNVGSIRVAAKLGYVEIARTTYKEAPVVLFERDLRKR